MKKRLFNIYDFVLKHDKLIVQIHENNYIDNTLVIPLHAFIQYLHRYDKLYFETNDFSTGQLVTKSYHLTFDNYWDEMEKEYKEEDIYDFIICTCIDFTTAIDKLESRLNQTLINYLW